MDLTLDNVYRHGESMTVFDFDSAGACWRSIEPCGVLRSSKRPLKHGWTATEECGLSPDTTNKL